MGIQILIVDDEPDVRESMDTFINHAGFDTKLAASAEEGIDLLKDHNFEVVITDIMLPGVSGLELTKIIRNKYDSDVIIMTGYSDDYSYEEAITVGASDFVIKPVRLEELMLRLRRVLRERKLTKDRIRMMEILQQLAITDGLTRLYNSRSFFSQLELEIDRSNRYNDPLALLLLDIDHFKDYNDSFGHLEGDKVLMEFSRVIKTCLRTNDSAYRYGGEEFTVILPETSAEEAKTVAQRIRSSLEGVVFVPQPDVRVFKTISIGLTEYFPKEDLTSFIKRADEAMYLSKQNGRNRVSVLYGRSSDKSEAKS